MVVLLLALLPAYLAIWLYDVDLNVAVALNVLQVCCQLAVTVHSILDFKGIIMTKRGQISSRSPSERRAHARGECPASDRFETSI